MKTREYLPLEYGRCDRAVNCAYHLNPYKDGYNLSDTWERQGPNYPSIPKPIPPSYIPQELCTRSLTAYPQNNLFIYLSNLFNTEIALAIMKKFQIGTSNYWKGATVFWQFDLDGKVRAGKVMLYNSNTGKRQKQVLADGSRKNMITWVHSILSLKDYNLQQCLFGLNQLDNNTQLTPVAIVESEKTAIIATVYLPQFIWLACGSLTNLSMARLTPLKGREVILFPDLGAFETWNKKAGQLMKDLSVRITVSNFLECRAADRDKAHGFDLADYLVRTDHKAGWALADEGYPLFWDNPLSLPVDCHRAKLFQQEMLKYWKMGKQIDAYELALILGLELGHAIEICGTLSVKYGLEFG